MNLLVRAVIVSNFRPNQSPPVSEGQEVDVIIESVGEKGDGVAKVKGFVLFVPQAQKGESLRVRVKKVLKSVAFAEKLGPASTLVEPSRPSKPQDAEIDFDSLGEGTEDFGDDLED